jgi:hydrogenase maturation protease
MIRVLAIGNRQKQDDAIAILIAEQLKDNFSNSDIDIIIGEVNYEYCFELLKEEDLIIILTAIHSHKFPGTISLCALDKAINDYSSTICLTNIFDLMKQYQLTYTGYMLGIHISDINFNTEISHCLLENFKEIYKNIQAIIINILKNEKFLNTIRLCNQKDEI